MLDLMTASVHSKVLVGRDADLTALRDAFRRARGAEPATLLVGGEAGVGKTRLVDEFRRSLSPESVRVLTGQCLELGEEGLPFAPFAAALRELIRAEGMAALDGRENELARLLPELGSPPVPGDTRRGLLFETIAALLTRLAAQRPLVLIVEDLHWADQSTRDLIGFLVRAARVPSLLLLATYRTDELHRGHPLRPFLAELDRVRGVQRRELTRLDRAGTAEMLGHLLGAEPDPPVVDAVNERTQGNPFFIEQFATSADPACSDIPTTLRDLLLSRVDQLPDEAQALLRVAAVGGNKFGHELLARVGSIDEPALDAVMRVIVAANLVVFDPDGGYEFRHALVREAVHDDLLPGEHTRLHARYACEIETDPQLVPMGRAAAEVAHHWLAARDHPRALVAAKVAADEAGRSYAYAEQARLLERAIDLWEDVPAAAELLGVCHSDLLEEAALAAIEAGELMRALTLTRAALDDLNAEAEPIRAARLLLRRVKLMRSAGKSDGESLAREAYRLLTTAPHGPDRVLLLADVAYVFDPYDLDLARRAAQEATELAAELGDVAVTVAAELAVSEVCLGRTPAEEGLVTMRALADQARALGDDARLARTQVNISDMLWQISRYEESAAAAAAGLKVAGRVGVSRTHGVLLLANLAEALIALGRWDEADARLEAAARLDPPGTMALPWLRLRAWLSLARGHERAVRLVPRAIAFQAKAYLRSDQRLYLAELHVLADVEAGDAATAIVTARAALADDAQLMERHRYTWPLLATAVRVAGEDPVLAARIRELVAVLPHDGTSEAFAATVAARLACLDGSPDAVKAWRDAVASWRDDGNRYGLAIALVDLAEVLAADDRAGAGAALTEAEGIAAALGASPLVERIEQLCRRIGIRATVAEPGTEILTAREREVLRLVAEGQSNSRIAANLYISPKTASVHVSRIIAKLEVANRVEAAAVAHRLGLLTE